ncbi:nucleotidyl transferase AbiEii/AbiGii toxin family protein [Flagellimonas iocasae]|uniref:Nucleotidyl transferase AbiEii/AbiGii toxin family protein n=1 Tax=Flagellimonas iocasae TaxID=2055905 RepID=A0ABW4Y1N3_9FLAO
MIDTESLTKEWINQKAGEYRSDPILVEKVVWALYLLEQLKKSNLEFLFKGGTALTLLLPEPKRFSIDIDIIVENKPEVLNTIFDALIQSSDFIGYEEDVRKTKSDIEKAHFKFYYKPVTKAPSDQEYILLDILFEDSHYEGYTEMLPIDSPFLKLKDNPLNVEVPTPEAILGDKLTAFAPNTTGVPYGRGKEVEIIKQLFDVGHLFDMVRDIEVVAAVFNRFAQTELAYRNIMESNDAVLEDIFETAMVIATRGKSGIGQFQELQKGIQNIKNYIFSENFHLERAMVPAAKAAYLSALIKTEAKEIHRFSNPEDIVDWTIDQPDETRLNKLKKTNPEAFFYWWKTLELKNKS